MQCDASNHLAILDIGVNAMWIVMHPPKQRLTGDKRLEINQEDSGKFTRMDIMGMHWIEAFSTITEIPTSIFWLYNPIETATKWQQKKTVKSSPKAKLLDLGNIPPFFPFFVLGCVPKDLMTLQPSVNTNKVGMPKRKHFVMGLIDCYRLWLIHDDIMI